MSAPPELLYPYDLRAEKALLGCVLRDPRSDERVADWFPPADCYLQKHEQILAACRRLLAAGEPVDLVTVAHALEVQGHLAEAGGVSYLAEVMAAVPHAAHIERYARIVQDTAVRRRLIEAGGTVASLGYNREASLEKVAAEAERAVQQALATTGHREVDLSLRGAMDALLVKVTSSIGQGGMTGLRTGWTDLDALTGGLQPSDLIILAARPSVGKSSAAMSIAYYAARCEQATVGVFSLEMSREQMSERLLAIHTGIDSQRIRTGNLRNDELTKAVDGMGELGRLPIYIEDTPGMGIADLQRRARRMHARRPMNLLIVDYLQLMVGDGNTDNRVQEVSEISRGLKILARELNIPVIALSQLSRAVEGRQSKVPMLSDLRESGSIEQDADIVWFIYREELYDKETDKKGIAELHMAKHRNGALGVIALRFNARTTHFQNLDRYRAPEGY